MSGKQVGRMHNLLIGGIRGMAHSTRYSTYTMQRKENVAEHTGWVCMYSFILCQILFETERNMIFEAAQKGEEFLSMYPKGEAQFVYRVMAHAACHDMGEAVTGDVVRAVKRKDPEVHAGINRIEGVLLGEMVDREGLPGILKYWAGSPDCELEVAVVHLADTMCVASTLLEEAIQGNHVATNRLLKAFLPRIREEIVEIEDNFGKRGWSEFVQLWRDMNDAVTSAVVQLPHPPPGLPLGPM